MAVKTAAALLDELMGRNRNSLPNQQVKELHWDDDEVCFRFGDNCARLMYETVFVSVLS